MKLLRGSKNIAALKQGSVATIGNFDGVHLGHQNLLMQLKEQALWLKLPVVVIIFEPQPGEYFLKDQAPPRLTSLREKLLLLKHCGVDYVYCINFQHKLASMSPIEFANQILFDLLQIRYLLIGRDFRFGYQRLGNHQLLVALGQQRSCEVQIADDFLINNERISSTQVRMALQSGDILRAAKLLGRTYSICGRVVHGLGLGRQWDIPTANFSLNSRRLPLKGVFCVQIQRNGQALSGVANVGYRPTINGNQLVLEVHLFDFNEDLYGELLQVIFLQKLRDEVKFALLDDLVVQIRQDIQHARDYFTA